ncbi:hypothetical protein [Burkholderia sp. AU38729]|uniref:hypothetical protein n=1 Tax=Burkholderia sp. AU38729 TaxID=2879633 RepID=UPI001CF1B478|nr:hypothetical protein [Burkholderia sp. AU38729]MCA8061284.1 hypothetical protein [Burkholderia sp. AU38729]
MRAVRGFVAVMMLATSPFLYAADIYKTLSPYPGEVAVISIDGRNLVWKLTGGNVVRRGEVSFDTDKPLSLEVGSYDFSGRLGFLVSYMDDGMGVYEIARIFTFSPSSSDFVERFPSCGDEFVNLKVDGKSHLLTSTYWDKNIPKRCITRLSVE